jgi:glycosyltransferase involved in cell wall biosynthesis
MSDTPAISVVLPAHNAECFVTLAVNSILHQNFTDLELIVIDDGSTDRTGAILRDLARTDSRLHLIQRENRGMTASLTEGLAVARGRFIARMDADDISLPDRFDIQLAKLIAEPELVCIGGGQMLIDSAGRMLRKVSPPTDHQSITALILGGHGAICHPTALMRRDAIDKIGGYREEFWPAEDLDLWLRLGEIGRLANVDRIVLHYRIHPDSVSERNGVIQRERAHAACAQAWARRGIDGAFSAHNLWRPDGSRKSVCDHMIDLGWSAFHLNQRQTALVYGLKGIRMRCWSFDGWKLAARAAFWPVNQPIYPAQAAAPSKAAAPAPDSSAHGPVPLQAPDPSPPPRVSVLMTVYNSESHLAEAIRSILTQTLTDFEFIILNDGSTDGSAAILEEFAASDGRIRLVQWPNHGITPGRVALLSMARAPLVAIMDADDISLPDRLKVQADYLDSNGRCVAVGCRVMMVDDHGRPLRTWSLELTHREIETAYLQRRGSAIVHPAVMMRRDAVIAAGGYDVRFATCEDQDLFLRLAERGELANVPDILFHYRQHVASTCHTRSRQLWKDSEAVLKEAYARRGLGEITDATPAVLADRPADFHRRWGWWALRSGYVATARRHAAWSLARQPLCRESWTLAACAARGW